jgi:hypothetical protein
LSTREQRPPVGLVAVTTVDGRSRRRFEVTPGQELAFGHHDTELVVGADERDISRLAGRILFDDGRWWVRNESDHRFLEVVDPGANRTTRLAAIGPDRAPGRYPIGITPLEIVVGGPVLRQVIHAVLAPVDGVHPATFTLVLTPRQMEAVVALAWWYLQPVPDYRPEPASYAEAAQRLGVTEQRLSRLIEDVRVRMIDAGLPGLVDHGDAPAAVCAHALANRLVGAGSCAWLRRRLALSPDQPLGRRTRP